MRKLSTILLLFIAFFSLPAQSLATHILGHQLGYNSVAPGVYLAEYKTYLDCRGGITPAPTVQLNLSSPGCAGTQVITANKVATINYMQPYCGAIGNGCNPAGLLNIIEITYSAVFMVPSACPEYYLSVRECSVAPVANLSGPGAPGATCRYLEAYINTTAFGNHNTSPGFLNPNTSQAAISFPNLFFTVNSPATISNLAFPQHPAISDSIGYALKPALDNVGTPLVYAAGTSFTNPVPSSSGVTLQPETGLLTFTPNVYNATGNYASNTYTVIVEATGYKQINGVMTKVNSTQRSLPVIIVNNAPNQNPEIINATANGNPIQPNDIILVTVGDQLTFQFGTADANGADSVSVELPNPNYSYLPWGMTFTQSSGNRPTGTLVWDSNNSTPGDFFYFPVIVKDNACPVRGVTTRMFGIKVIPRTTGVKKDAKAQAGFTAFPNPFSDKINFTMNPGIKAESIVIYNLLGQQIDQISLPASGLSQQQISWGNAAQVAKGTYVARLVSEGKTLQMVRFIKQ